MRSEELEDLRVAALLHELGPQDPRLLRLFEQFPGAIRQLPITTSMRAALDLVREYSHYHEHVGADWPVDLVRGSLAVKVLAVADAVETPPMPSPNRPPFSSWSAVEEIERGAGQIFATEVVRALRKIAAAPERAVDSAADTLSLEQYRERVAGRGAQRHTPARVVRGRPGPPLPSARRFGIQWRRRSHRVHEPPTC